MTSFSLRHDHREPSPVPHPQVGGEIPADPEQEGADRVGEYVRRALTRELERRGVPWPVQVSWSEHTITAWLSRGELTLSTQERRRRWWTPVNRHTADQLVEGLAYVLHLQARHVANPRNDLHWTNSVTADRITTYASTVLVFSGSGARVHLRRPLDWEDIEVFERHVREVPIYELLVAPVVAAGSRSESRGRRA